MKVTDLSSYRKKKELTGRKMVTSSDINTRIDNIHASIQRIKDLVDAYMDERKGDRG